MKNLILSASTAHDYSYTKYLDFVAQFGKNFKSNNVWKTGWNLNKRKKEEKKEKNSKKDREEGKIRVLK